MAPGCMRPLNFKPLPPVITAFQSACCCSSAWIIPIWAAAGMTGMPGKCPSKHGMSAASTQRQERVSPSRERLILSKLNTGLVMRVEQPGHGLARQFTAGRARQFFNDQNAPGDLDAIQLAAKVRLQLPG